MLPYIEVFSRRIPMYGLMAGLGVLLAVLYVKRAEKRYPALEADAELAFVYGIVGAFVGAKLLFLCTVLPELRADLPYLWTQTAAFLKKYLSAGFVFFGGLYGALAAALLYARLTRTSAEKLLNMLLPAVLLIHGLGRVGCFCMGCCYGKPSENGASCSPAQRSPRRMCRCCLSSSMRRRESCCCSECWPIWARKRRTASGCLQCICSPTASCGSALSICAAMHTGASCWAFRCRRCSPSPPCCWPVFCCSDCAESEPAELHRIYRLGYRAKHCKKRAGLRRTFCRAGTIFRQDPSNKQLLQHGMVTNSECLVDAQKAGGNGNEAGKGYYLL